MLNEDGMTFKSLEVEIYRKMCEIGCELLREILEQRDAQLERERDKSVYRHKGTRETSIKTLMGTVTYRRTVYAATDGECGKKHVYLLDQEMQRETVGLVSAALAESILESCCDMPYRKASAAVSNMTGQPISHTGAWNVVQAVGAQIEQQEAAAGVAASQGRGSGRNEIKLLFEEMDGIWLKLQGKDRKKHGGSREMKLAIAYAGARKTGKDRYELQHKVACANFETVQSFFVRKEGVIAGYYAADEIETRILGGDGATWIRGCQGDETIHYQLDTFHRNKAVVRAVRQREAREEIFKLLYIKQASKALEYIEILANSVSDEAERQGLIELSQYLKNNEDGLIGYHRRGLTLPEPPDDLEYRRLGAVESNVFSLIGHRMKGRRAAWSIRGGNNLARLLCLKATGRLKESLRNMTGTILPPEYTEEVPTVLSAHSIKERMGKGYNGYHHFMPSDNRSWLKDFMGLKPLSAITLR